MYTLFFSSRRRHTRLQGDWSSDVCSSDLVGLVTGDAYHMNGGTQEEFTFDVDALPFDYDMVNNLDRKSTRLNSSHLVISYAVFCLKKKKHVYLASLRRLRESTAPDPAHSR